MSDDELLLSDEELEELTEDELAEYGALLAEVTGLTMDRSWRQKARPEQLPPDGDWEVLFLRGGRGGGKSWAASHILAELIVDDPLRDVEGPGQFAIVAPTYGDVRDVAVEAPESGLLAAFGTGPQEVAAGRSATVEGWNRSLGEVKLRDGSVVYCDGADDGALRIQGKNLRAVWAEEIGLWKRWETAFDESIAYALRKGEARLVVTGTPKADQPARALVRRLLADPAVVTRRLRTMDNAANLSKAFLEAAAERAGSRLGLQELEGELLDDIEGALWKRSWFDREGFRVAGPPEGGWQRAPVIGVDPSDGTQAGAEQAYTAVGLGSDHLLYVIESKALRVSPYEFAVEVIGAAQRLGAIIVLEKNHGGGWLREVFERAMKDLGVQVAMRVVHAAEGKRTRAEPVAALYEPRDDRPEGRVRHIGHHPELEDEQATWQGGPGERSPNLVDSLVWAMSTFTSMSFGPPSTERTVFPYNNAPTHPTVVPWRDGPSLDLWVNRF